MKYLTYHLISPEGYKVDYMTSGQKKDPTLKFLIEGHDMRVSTIEKYGWRLERAKTFDKPKQIIDGKTCPKCGGLVWDNRQKIAEGKFSPKAPDFSCEDKLNCKWAVWKGGYEIKEATNVNKES